LLQLTVFGDSSDSIVLIITIIFFAALFISFVVAAVAEHVRGCGPGAQNFSHQNFSHPEPRIFRGFL
jgi:hypothetical protein